ncbi:MAG TPA: T9SS type A sorting domain-containing protein, partial [Bacteroidales bacterium]|nr:T9SS type A sorting domain-containing protein [Bacteroidales bacterium]
LSFTSYSSSAKLEMFDLSGKQIMSIGFNTSQGYVRHKLMLPGDIHSGIYLLRIKQNGQSREQKLLIRNRP